MTFRDFASKHPEFALAAAGQINERLARGERMAKIEEDLPFIAATLHLKQLRAEDERQAAEAQATRQPIRPRRAGAWRMLPGHHAVECADGGAHGECRGVNHP